MRLLGIVLLVAILLAMIFGLYRNAAGSANQLLRFGNIAVCGLLAVVVIVIAWALLQG